VGGFLSTDVVIQTAVAVAVRILHGESPGGITLEPEHVPWVFDWRELRRWHINEASLPAGSRIEFRIPTLWDYKPYIVGSLVVLLTQTALIGGLLIQRSKRRSAERELRSSQTQLRASYVRIRRMGRLLLRTQEAERARVAREVHDDINQQLAILSCELHALQENPQPLHSRERLSRALERTHAVSKSLHNLSHRLHPSKLELLGLIPAIAELQRDFSRSHLTIVFSHRDVPAVIDHDVALCVFRIVQEALSNALKHSHADRVFVDLGMASNGVQLTVEDNGKGFDLNDASIDGLGLISMRERVESIGGVLEIHSKPKSGTRLRATVPTPAALDVAMSDMAIR